MLDGTESLGKYFVADNDHCITRTGKFLRKYKIDELPQLINVLIGDMSLVGPRPMIPRIVAQYPASVRNIVLSVPPGITGLASIAYIDENEMLSASSNPKYLYDKHILPIKLHYYVYYVFAHNVWLDLKIILLTFVYLARLIYGSIRKKEHQKFAIKW
jgi:lipopolysaccharide/colanic/teichoic acid biosynthesis glycosyltransferase